MSAAFIFPVDLERIVSISTVGQIAAFVFN